MRANTWAVVALAVAVAPGASAAPFENQPTIRAMKDELARSMGLEIPGFGKPYFLSYEMWDTQRASVTASFGALVGSGAYPGRTVDIDLRIGDPAFDNSNVADRDRSRSITLGQDDDYDMVRHELWLATDRAYKHAAETLERKRAVAKGETKSDDDAASFSREPPSHIVDDRAAPAIDQARLETLAKTLSAVFRAYPEVHVGTVTIAAATGKQYFVSSEGSASVQTSSFVKIGIECSSQADDGMPVHDSLSFFVETLAQLPPEAELVAQVDKLARELSALRVAPVVDDYTGPVLFTSVASGQVIRSLLAEQLAGTPAPKNDRPGFRSVGESELVGKVGARILPAGVSVVDDPTGKRVGKSPVVGATRFDEEGVPSQRVSLVENGRFKQFLMSRIPRKGFEHSNGHAASSPASSPRAHPLALTVSSSQGLSDAQIRKRAIAAAKAADQKFVLVVEKLDYSDDLDGAMSRDATLPRPGVMKRVDLDGHEQLVRGATFGAVPMRNLKDLTAVGSTPVVYNYFGTGLGLSARYAIFFESSFGYLVSIAAPPLLFRDVDVKKPIGPHRTAPIAPRPK